MSRIMFIKLTIFVSMKSHIVLFGNLMSSGAAGATSLVICYPLDMARTRCEM